MKRAIKDVSLKNNVLEDNNNIFRQIILSYIFQVLRLIVIIFSISYFIGTLWYIFVWQLDKHSDPNQKDTFFCYYGFDVLNEENQDL